MIKQIKAETNAAYISIDTTRKAHLYYVVLLAGELPPELYLILNQKLTRKVI